MQTQHFRKCDTFCTGHHSRLVEGTKQSDRSDASSGGKVVEFGGLAEMVVSLQVARRDLGTHFQRRPCSENILGTCTHLSGTCQTRPRHFHTIGCAAANLGPGEGALRWAKITPTTLEY
ncbi:hypothetical protein M758_7G162500 [Ceratodon purpureus]|nr:hypothetical protein M758_7G162500 [Ceratodon purpureus]